jgi:hypothetical protein
MLPVYYISHKYIKIFGLATITFVVYPMFVALAVTAAYVALMALHDYRSQTCDFGAPTKQNVEAYVHWCRKYRKTIDINRCFGMNLQGLVWDGIDLQGALLRGVKLNGTRMVGANLKNAIFDGSSLRFANCMRADFSGASLQRTDMSYANMRFTVIASADIRGMVFFGSDFRHANFSEARHDTVLPSAECTGCDLSDAHRVAGNLSSPIVVTTSRVNVQGKNIRPITEEAKAAMYATSGTSAEKEYVSKPGFRYYHAYHHDASLLSERRPA